MKINTVNKNFRVLGLMSGTSLDGVDVALIETDGADHVAPLGFSCAIYPDCLRQNLRACFGLRTATDELRAAEREMTLFHAEAVKAFLDARGLTPSSIDLIGFHGQTITHDPAIGFTWQLGDGALLARELGIDVVYDFRTQDVAAGGEGAPLIPVYHYARARASQLKRPVAILNIGGVSNVTWIDGGVEDILAFDCGPGNALIDDLILKHTGERFDRDGALALQGTIHEDVLARWMDHPFFTAPPPKSLDRGAWDVSTISNFPLGDAAATLTEFTVRAVVQAATHFPTPAREWYVCGGGRHNRAIMEGLRASLGAPVEPVDTLGWNGDALEAEGFAYMAVLSRLGKPISFPRTTRVKVPMTGGRFSAAKD